MRKIRAERLKALLQSEVATFMIELRQDLEMPELIGVDEVFVTPDLKMATIWLSITPQPTPKISDILMRKIEGATARLKSWLAGRLELRQVPKIFIKFSDPSKQYHLEDIFDGLDKD